MVKNSTHREERKKSVVVYLQNYPCFKVEISKLPMVSVLC